jgi:hypothetical protein
MKLEEYAIKDALQREDWVAAIAVLAAHFDIPMPAVYRLDLLRDECWLYEIKITRGECVYWWLDGYGFETRDSWSWRPPEEVVVGICAPLVRPAGPKAGAARSRRSKRSRASTQ